MKIPGHLWYFFNFLIQDALDIYFLSDHPPLRPKINQAKAMVPNANKLSPIILSHLKVTM